MIAGFTSTPMPGETLESAENGEIQNPYYNAGFENLADDLSETDEQEPTIPETEPQLQQVQAEADSDTELASTAPTEDEKKPDNAITDSFGDEWNKGTASISIADQHQSINANYADGAVRQAADLLRPQTEEAIMHANSDFQDTGERSAQEQEDQEIKNMAESLTAQAMLVTDEAQAASEGIALGDSEADEHVAEAQRATETIDALASAGFIAMQDASTEEISQRLKSTVAEATAMAEAAQEQIETTRNNVEQAQNEAEEMAKETQQQAAENSEATQPAGNTAEANPETPAMPVFENLGDTLDDDQRETIIDAMVADNPYSSPENNK